MSKCDKMCLDKIAGILLNVDPHDCFGAEMTKKTLNLTQLSQYVGIHKRTLYRMLLDGRFPVDPIPKTKPRIWLVDDVDSWLTGGSRDQS